MLEDGRENIRIWDEHRLTTWFDRFLPTIDYSNKDAIDVMTDSALYMLEKYNLDGLDMMLQNISLNYFGKT